MSLLVPQAREPKLSPGWEKNRGKTPRLGVCQSLPTCLLSEKGTVPNLDQELKVLESVPKEDDISSPGIQWSWLRGCICTRKNPSPALKTWLDRGLVEEAVKTQEEISMGEPIEREEIKDIFYE